MKNWFIDDDSWTMPGWWPSQASATGSTGTFYLKNVTENAAIPIPDWPEDTITETKFWASDNHLADIWYKITAQGAATTVHVPYDYEIMYGVTGTVVPKSTGMTSWGRAGDGVLLMNSEPGVGAYVEVLSHDGQPWLMKYRYARLGALSGFLDGEAGEIGLGIVTDARNLDTSPYVVLSNKRNELYSVALTITTLVNGVRVVRGKIDPDAGEGAAVFWIGGTESDPAVYVLGGENGTTGIRDDLLIGSRSETFFSTANGTLLLSPQCGPAWAVPLLSSTIHWKASRGRYATLTGAFWNASGRWPGTYSIRVMPAVTNLITNPDAESNTLWAAGYNTTASRVETDPLRGGYCYRVTVEAEPGTQAALLQATVSQTPDIGDQYTFSAYCRTDRHALEEGEQFNYAEIWIEDSNGNITNSVETWRGVGWKRVSVTHTITEADVTSLTCTCHAWVDVGQYAYWDCFDLTKTGYPAPHVDGDMPGCTWAGTEHESTSSVTTRTVANLDALVDTVNYHDQLTISVPVQAPYSYKNLTHGGSDEEWYVWSFGDAAGLTESRMSLLYNASGGEQWGLWAQGFCRLQSVAGAHQFEAGDWLEMTLSLDMITNRGALYCNGVLLASTDSLGMRPLTATKWKLGAHFNDAGYERGQAIAQVAVFSTALSAGGAAALYNLNNPLSDMGDVDQAAGLHFPLFNSTAIVDTPGIQWSDGVSLAAIDLDLAIDAISRTRTLEMEIVAEADATTVDSAQIEIKAKRDTNEAIVMPFAAGAATTYVLASPKISTDDTNLWQLGAAAAQADFAGDRKITVIVNGATYELVAKYVSGE